MLRADNVDNIGDKLFVQIYVARLIKSDLAREVEYRFNGC